MNKRYANEDYDVVIFVDGFGRLVDWHYDAGGDKSIDEVYWNREPQPDGGNNGIYKELLKNGTDAPNVYLVDTWDGNIPGPPVLLFDWAFDGPARIYTVHLASDGRLDPPLPKTLANFVATAIKK